MPSLIDIPSKEIPQNLHLRWIGSTFPEKYIANLSYLLASASKSAFTLYLWTDKRVHLAGLPRHLQEHPSLRIRETSELDKKMQEDGFYSETERQLFWRIISIEARRDPAKNCDNSNFAAACDLLEQETLRQEGGISLDMDLPNVLSKGLINFRAVEPKLGYQIASVSDPEEWDPDRLELS